MPTRKGRRAAPAKGGKHMMPGGHMMADKDMPKGKMPPKGMPKKAPKMPKYAKRKGR